MIEKLRYSLYVIFHPFKGFWDIKRENKGNVYSASIIVLLMCLISVLEYTLTGYIVADNPISGFNIFIRVGLVLFPFILWCIGNWCTTTLFDGEGSFKDIFIMTAYAITPLVIIRFPLILLSNIIKLEEVAFYTFFGTVAVVWTAFLLFVGMVTIHQYSGFKTVLTTVLTILAMAILIFLILLIIALSQQFISFIELVYKELTLRS
ncbi:MAG: YIP1 family protein [Clostridia bacterium]|nr:YIP1 family protein [Clostridia bacterium]